MWFSNYILFYIHTHSINNHPVAPTTRNVEDYLLALIYQDLQRHAACLKRKRKKKLWFLRGQQWSCTTQLQNNQLIKYKHWILCCFQNEIVLAPVGFKNISILKNHIHKKVYLLVKECMEICLSICVAVGCWSYTLLTPSVKAWKCVLDINLMQPWLD